MANGCASTRIALLLPDLTDGGVERTTVTLAQGLLDRGLEIDLVLCRVRRPLLAEVPKAARIVPLPRSNLLLGRLLMAAADPGGIPELARTVLVTPSPPRSVRMLPALARYLRRERPAALISAVPFENLLAIAAKRLADADTKVIVTERNTTTRSTLPGRKWKRRFLPALVRRQYPMADAIVAVAEGVADELTEHTGLRRDQIVTIHNAVVNQAILAKAKEPVPHPWFAGGGPPVILGVGRLTDQKDFPTLIRAFAIVRTRREARLVIVGEGRPEARDHLQQLAADLACASDLSLPGFTYNPFCYMAAASVFVLSSLREGLPGMLIQALACGVPVVSTDCPSGPREILEGGTYGRWWHSGTTPRWPKRSSTPSINRGDAEARIARGRQSNVERSVDRYLGLLSATGLRVSTPPHLIEQQAEPVAP
jgi:glycosyltransferase involved in cell wall biosynthesis